MLFDKKKSMTAIFSKVGKDGSTSETEVKEEGGDHDVYTALAEDLIAGVKDGSIQKLASCLKDFHKMIESEDMEQDEG